MDTFTARPHHPSKRQKLPQNLHLHLHHQETERPDHVLSSSSSSPAYYNFNNQLLPPPPYSIPSLFHHDSRSDNSFHDARATLSLSLSADHQRCHATRDFDDRSRPVISCYDSNAWRSSVPLGPFTGYASILNRSRFLKPAQDLLDELCGLDSHLFRRNHYSFGGFSDDGNLDLIHSDDTPAATVACKEILLLDEVFKRYKRYYQHLQSVVASFEAVCGLGNAAPYISFARSAMVQQFTYLKKILFQRVQIAGEGTGYSSISNVALGCKDSQTECENPKPSQTPSAIQQPVWRSQRGLPAYAVAVFKNWLFEHFLHPYPSDSDKNLLAQQTGLSRNQVSNWFINARVRLWKPLVEEIHTLDEQQGQPAMKNDLKTSKATSLHQPPVTQSADHQPSTVALRILSTPYHDTSNPSCSESSNEYLSNSAVKHGKPDENIDISLALGLQRNNVSGNSAAYDDVNK